MANTITDNRTLVTAADAVGSFVGTSPVLDTEIFIQGTGSIAESFTNSIRTILFNAGAAQNWSNNTFYIWINCGIVGLLQSKAAGGFRIRFTGPTVTDFFEVYVGGNDDWPNAIAGGWVQFVVDIEAAAAAPDATGGTPPLTSAIQHVGCAGITTAMTRTTDNTWMDAIWRLPDGTAGILIQGQNGGTTPWSFADILTQLGQGSGAIKAGPAGSLVLNTPVQIGINDATSHQFADTNATVFWDNQEFAPADGYGISTVMGSGVNSVVLGTKTGAGNDAVGSQGVTIQAAETGVRWFLDLDDPNLDTVGLYGCNFVHGATFNLDQAIVDLATVLFLDCQKAHVSNANIVRATVVSAATADGVAFMDTDDLGDIVYSSFQFSDGHAVELLTPIVSTQASVGNTFSGYGATASNDAAVYNNAGGAVTINVSDGGTSPTYRDGAGASTNVVAGAVTVTLTVTDSVGDPVADARCIVRASDGTGPFPYLDVVTIVNSGATATVTHTGHGLATGDEVLIRDASLDANNGVFTITVTGVNTYTYTMGSTPGSSPTGTITSTFVVLFGLTDINGQISKGRVFPSAQPVTGSARKGSAAPYFKPAPVNGTVSNSADTNLSAVLISDD